MKYLFKIIILIFFSHNVEAQDKFESITPLEIVNKSIDAMGGIEYLKSIKTLYADTKTEMEGRQVHWIVKQMHPNKGSFEILYNNRTIYYDWFDGKNGYNISNDGRKRKSDPEEYKDKLYKKNIFNELDFLDSTLWALEYLGNELVGNDSCYKIRGTLKSGLVMLFFFSKKSFFMIKSDKISNPEKGRFTTYFYSNFKQFGKLVYPTEVKFGDGVKYQYGVVEKILINESVDISDFK